MQEKPAQKSQASVHVGHRGRMKERVLRSGLDSLADHEVLEILLYLTIPRADTNELAHRLLAHFGSVSQVLEADPEELQKVKGVGANTAFMLSLMPQLARRYLSDKNRERPVFGDTKAFAEYIMRLFVGEKHEVAYMLCLNASMRLIHTARLGKGDVGSVTVSVSDVVAQALRHNARCVVLAHNHPGGRLKVSADDFELTKRCMKALAYVQVSLLDHFVVCGDMYCSFQEKNYMETLKAMVRHEEAR
jgi:DNA repair protein RadC